MPKCGFCSYELGDEFLDLGETPLANSYIKNEHLAREEKRYPLKVYFCQKCLLVQIEEFKLAKSIFSDYLYFSSFSSSWSDHCNAYFQKVSKQFSLNYESKVIEIASNDGTLLEYFKKQGINVLGIEPAQNVAQVAKEKGIATEVAFFDYFLADKLKSKGGLADLVIANNVLAHVPNLKDFVSGIKIILKENGVATFEFPHLLNLIKFNQFDTIYHEHIFYFSVLFIEKLFYHSELKIFDVEKLSTHGGSLRIYACHQESNFKQTTALDNLKKEELLNGLDKLETYVNFSLNIQNCKKNFLSFLSSIQSGSKIILCYGAPAKGNTFLNYCGVNTAHIAYTVDKNNFKQNHLLPGSHLPIKNPSTILKDKPDFLLILPWNIKDEVMQQMSAIKEWSGKFVVAIPELQII